MQKKRIQYLLRLAVKKTKKAFAAAKFATIRFFKSLSPNMIRKNYLYRAARLSGGFVTVNTGMKDYMDALVRLSENPEHAFMIRSTEKMSEKEGRSYLSVPLTEARFLEVFVKSIGAAHALEIGTFRGFSAGFIARGLAEGGVLFACDEDPRPVPAATRFWQSLGVDQKIHFELGDAREILAKLTSDQASLEFFDFIFIDADKKEYQHYVEEGMKLLRPGGSMIIDNTLWKGLVQYEDSRDNGAEHLKKFNMWLFDTYKDDVSIVPAWDGLTLVVKKNK